ncbi:hypothetical protein H6503_01685 [Candidatus Woesearchaeota archaeon]|nr:hypothetical protein [Candidatus Woesearchaeota archaeon]
MENKAYNIKIEDGIAYVTIKPQIYGMKVILTACYALLQYYYFHIEGDPETELTIRIIPQQKEDITKFANEFENELIKSAFYKKQHDETLGIKTLMMKRILAIDDDLGEVSTDKSQTEILEPVKEIMSIKKKEDSFDDPEGIAVPWGKNDAKN